MGGRVWFTRFIKPCPRSGAAAPGDLHKHSADLTDGGMLDHIVDDHIGSHEPAFADREVAGSGARKGLPRSLRAG
ncbi:hypothetical protein Mth01_48260 [Sphaerimonospora thailandensis]|uniref:Uncharacterized protein n=1 Tax=Sphaerimonospora thailandensis TaxID=795644 RepID=A0A8J3W1Y1_9ACTN|nr:hypothetical protein Mth01_48260 [Sphaerimonospora thailandensis]